MEKVSLKKINIPGRNATVQFPSEHLGARAYTFIYPFQR